MESGYYYGLKFNKEWLIRGIKELLCYIEDYKPFNIIYVSPIDSKYFYIIYNENLIKRDGNIKEFEKCNHWIYVRQKLDHMFDIIIQKFICEFIDYPREIYHF